jgi:hypothetical protein
LPAFPKNTPQWLCDAVGNLALEDLGNNYKSLLEALIRVEAAHGFPDDTMGGVSAKLRPGVVAMWIRGARGQKTKKPPVIKPRDMLAYSDSWQAWWDTLQPSWRTKDAGGKWRITQEYGDDWTPLEFLGANGVLSVVASLYFWATNMRMLSSVHGEAWFVEEENKWDKAVQDVVWMLEGLYAYLEE